MSTPSKFQTIACWVVAWAFLLGGAAVFAYRAPMRMSWIGTNLDAGLLPIGGRIWAAGGNPYDLETNAKAWLEVGGPPDRNTAERGRGAFVFPPSAYVLGAPLGQLSINGFRPIWNWLCVFAFIADCVLVMRLARVPLRSEFGLIGLGLALAMAPSHTCIALGQTATVVLLAVLGGISLREAGRPWLAGICFGLACSIKPQIGLIFAAYELGRGRWRITLGAAVTFGVLLTVGLIRMKMAGIDGWSAWLANSRALLEVDANPLAGPRAAHAMIDLASPIAVLLGPSGLATARMIALVATGLAAGMYAVIDYRRGGAKSEGRPELLSAAAVSVVMLLVAYHRLYDAVFLIIPLALALSQLQRSDNRGWITLLLLVPFFAPGGSILVILGEEGVIPASISGAKWWTVFFVQHETWTLCLLLAWCIFLRRKWPGGHPEPAPNPRNSVPDHGPQSTASL